MAKLKRIVVIGLCVGLLAIVGGCASPGGVKVSTPFGDGETIPPAIGVPVKTIDFKDCLARYERALGSSEHDTRAWCDCHIGQDDQWRGQQWQAYCRDDEPEAPPPAPASSPAGITPHQQAVLDGLADEIADLKNRLRHAKEENRTLNNAVREHANRANDAEAALDIVDEGCPRFAGKDEFHRLGTTTHTCDCNALAVLPSMEVLPVFCEDGT